MESLLSSSAMSSALITTTALLIVLLSPCTGNNDICDVESCFNTYTNLKGLLDVQGGDWMEDDEIKLTVCSLHRDLKDCIKKQSKKCRGDLNYHFLVKLAERTQVEKNCSSRGSGSTGSPPQWHSHVSRTSTSPGHRGHNHDGRGGPSRHLSRSSSELDDGCSPRSTTKNNAVHVPTVGCALYGLTNLKSFSDPLNFTNIPYCSLSGAWSLIDTPEFAVQITNKGGLNPMPKDITTTTFVTVNVKSNKCATRKTYHATFDEVPGMFSDGKTSAGNVFINTIVPSEHVRINFPYLDSTIDIIKVVGHLPIPTLSVTIKMPQVNVSDLMDQPGRIPGFPLCFYGCPKTASIKPRSVSTPPKCGPPAGSSSEESSRSASSTSPDRSLEHLDTANSINSAICDSLTTVQNILGESSVLEPKLRYSGDEVMAILADQSSQDDHSRRLTGGHFYGSPSTVPRPSLFLHFLFILSSLFWTLVLQKKS